MKTFLLYEHPTKGFKAVKSGFSWPAFFFMLFWACLKRLYGFGLLMFCVWLFVAGVYAITIHEAWGFSDAGFITLLLMYALVMGISGNKYLSQSLVKRGYRLVKTIQAESAGFVLSEARAAAGNKYEKAVGLTDFSSAEIKSSRSGGVGID
jgi:hypothetical protein